MGVLDAWSSGFGMADGPGKASDVSQRDLGTNEKRR